MAHVRRKFVDIHRSQGSPIAEEAIGRIAQLHAVEKQAIGSPPDVRIERRNAHAAPVFNDLEVWLAVQLTTISGTSPLAAAIRYALSRMERREGADGGDPGSLIHGVSTRAVDDLVRAMGQTGTSKKKKVSRLCEDIDERVQAFLNRPLESDWPFLWLDATYVKLREGGRIVSMAVIVAVAVNTDGRREILGITVMPSEAETFWTEFLRSLADRGLRGAKLVIADDQNGLRAAARRVFNATHQRCRMGPLTNLPAIRRRVPQGTQGVAQLAR